MNTTIGDRIRDRRIQLCMSQDYLAKAVGYKNRATISMIENGINDVPRKKVPLFARALNTTTDYLNGFENSEILQALIEQSKPNTPYDDVIGKIKTLNKTELSKVSEYIDFIISMRK